MEEQKDKPAVKKCEKDDGPAPVDDKKEQLERKTEGDAVVKNHRKVKDSAKRIVIVGASSGMGAEIARQVMCVRCGVYVRSFSSLFAVRKEGSLSHSCRKTPTTPGGGMKALYEPL